MANPNRTFKDAIYEQFARIGKAVGSPRRLELLDLLCQGERTVEVLAREAGLSVANASQHLRALRAARLVDAHKDGLYVTYRLADDDVCAFVRSVRLLAESRLMEVRSDLAKAFSKSSGGPLAFMQSFVRRQVLEPDRMVKIARDVLAAEKIIDRYRPHRVVVDGKRNHPVRTYLELAHVRGIETDHMWHSPLVPQYLQFDAFGCDPREESIITRCLSWGRINEAWLDAIEAHSPRVRIGCPLSDRYAKTPQATESKGNNALVLQYAPVVSDLRGLNINIYEHFIDVIRLLNDKGYDNIRYKLHPGPGRWKKNYFAEIARTFGIRCEILKTEPFEECVAWADIVVGPTASGAMFETLAAGKPYHAMLVPPHSMNPGFFGDFPVHSSVDELALALDRPWHPEVGRKLLDGLYSTEEYPSGSKRFWAVMREDLGDPQASQPTPLMKETPS